MSEKDYFYCGIGYLDQSDPHLSPRQDDFVYWRFFEAKEIKVFIQRQIVAAQCNVDFVQQHHADRCIADQLPGIFPACARGGVVALVVLGGPMRPSAMA
mgnify:CR=1 FL=1